MTAADDDLEFGDIEPEDVGDEEGDLSQVDKLADQMDEIEAIEHDDKRLEAAKAWAAELEGDS